ncbi:MAG: hypothetical protein NT121_03165 [Chloroflexi bacterium]|nr:hypothetical protein [Chloroflexota bacterium]
MSNTRRLPSALVRGLIVLAIIGLSCQFVTNLAPGNRQPLDQDQQNQQQDQNWDEPPDQNLEPDQNQGNQPNNGAFDIVGIWDSQVETSQGTVSTRLILEHTGTFSQTVTWNGLMTLDTGEYNIIGNAVHFTVTHHEPTEFQDQPMSWVTSFTYFVTPIDATSMQVEDHIMNTSWTMYKTGP